MNYPTGDNQKTALQGMSWVTGCCCDLLEPLGHTGFHRSGTRAQDFANTSIPWLFPRDGPGPSPRAAKDLPQVLAAAKGAAAIPMSQLLDEGQTGIDFPTTANSCSCLAWPAPG